MKNLIIFFLAIIFSPIKGQNVIYRTGVSGSEFYYGTIDHNFLNMVIDDSTPGDTLYLPGGNFSIIGNVDIDKKLIIIGAGIKPDSSSATGSTVFGGGINFQFTFSENADNSEVHGIFLDDNRFDVELFETINGLKFVRCGFKSARLNNKSTTALFQECIGGNIDVNGANSVTIRNCIFDELFRGGPSTFVENSIILNNTIQEFQNTNESVTYRNNIFTRNSDETVVVGENSVFINNLWIAKDPSQSQIVFEPGIQNSDNLKTNNISNVFINALNYTEFQFGANYDINPGSIYETMGTNMSEVGAFGGPSPMKKGLQPFNPHWQEFNLPISTQGGILNNVNIKASAQQN